MKRRHFLQNGLALGCSAAASPLMTPVVFAAAPTNNRLVVVLLRGAMDGLDAVRPIGDRDWASLRPTRTDETTLHDPSGFFGLNQGLDALAPLWHAGELAAVHAVSTPYRDRRSHFDGQDLLEAGLSAVDSAGHGGWLNRLLQVMPGASSDTAYAIGRERLLILAGEAQISSWSPDARLNLSAQARHLLEVVQHDDPLFRDTLAEAIEIAADVADGPRMGQGAFNGDHARLAEFAANRLSQEARIASFSLAGWDTHAHQDRALPTALGRLSEVILTLKSGLGPHWANTAVICITEFGRTARLNGTGGTDHGTGGAMLCAGGALHGGRVLGQWPGLAEATLYAQRDLMPTRDLRAHVGWVIRGLFGTSIADIETHIFPGVELGPPTGLLL